MLEENASYEICLSDTSMVLTLFCAIEVLFVQYLYSILMDLRVVSHRLRTNYT